VSIKRDDIDNRKVDFSNIASGRRLPPMHPGDILRDEFLTPMKIRVYGLANAIQVPRTRANDIVLCRRRSRSIPRFASGDTSGHHRSSRSIFRRVRSGFSRPHRAASDRTGSLAPRGLTETADVPTRSCHGDEYRRC
jgi:hypothetical protein